MLVKYNFKRTGKSDVGGWLEDDAFSSEVLDLAGETGTFEPDPNSAWGGATFRGTLGSPLGPVSVGPVVNRVRMGAPARVTMRYSIERTS